MFQRSSAMTPLMSCSFPDEYLWSSHQCEEAVTSRPVSERFAVQEAQTKVVTSLCLPGGINNEERSPCLSFNSIFTPCQMHLEAFHHGRSLSATFPSIVFIPAVNVWWAAQRCWGVVYLRLFNASLGLCLEHLPPLLPGDSSPFSGTPFSFPQGKFGLDWIRQGKVGRRLWSVCGDVRMKVRPDASILPPASAGRTPPLFRLLLFALQCTVFSPPCMSLSLFWPVYINFLIIKICHHM